MEVTVILCTNYKKQTISAEWLNDTSYIHTVWNPVKATRLSSVDEETSYLGELSFEIAFRLPFKTTTFKIRVYLEQHYHKYIAQLTK